MKRTLALLKKSTLVSGALAFILPKLVLAQDDVRDGLDLVGDRFGSLQFNDFGEFAVFIIEVLLFVAGAIAVVFVIIGGYQYMISAGNQETAAKGKRTVVNAIIGIVVIILSYLIISVIVNTLLGYESFF